MSRLFRVAKTWIPLAIVATGLFAAAYLAVQQDIRMGADDPQIALAEDAAAALRGGAAAADVATGYPVDITSSLAAYIIVFDAQGEPIAGTAQVDGRLPKPPMGVLTSAASSGENRVTWQPLEGVRMATVSVSTGAPEAPYVLVGRSLREAESRIAEITALMAIVWILTLVASLAAIAILDVLGAKRARTAPAPQAAVAGEDVKG